MNALKFYSTVVCIYYNPGHSRIVFTGFGRCINCLSELVKEKVCEK